MTGFKMVTKKTFPWPVKIKVPSDTKPGQFETQEIIAQFKAMSKDEIGALAKERAKIDDEVELVAFDFDQLCKSIVGWKAEDILDEDEKPVEFSTEALKTVLKFAWSRIGFLEAYAQAMTGEPAKGN